MAFLRIGVIYGLAGFPTATMINFFARFHFYFNFVNGASKIHAYQQMGKLLYRHQIVGYRSGPTLEETMPVGTSKAAVISFDVQNSAALGHGRSHEFFESINKKSYELMIGHYEVETRSSDAFLIKEMGDGFLCSVGFPFPYGSVQSRNRLCCSPRNLLNFSKGKQPISSPIKLFFAASGLHSASDWQVSIDRRSKL